MDLLTSHDCLSFICDHQQDRTNGDSQERDENDGCERGDGGYSIWVGVQPFLECRYKVPDCRQGCQGAEEGDGKDLPISICFSSADERRTQARVKAQTAKKVTQDLTTSER